MILDCWTKNRYPVTFMCQATLKLLGTNWFGRGCTPKLKTHVKAQQTSDISWLSSLRSRLGRIVRIGSWDFSKVPDLTIQIPEEC